jgi:phospholipase C
LSSDEGITRRDVVRAGVALGATGLALDPLLRPIVGTADAWQRRCFGGLRDIQHIVVLMQENRSFDQFFGTYPGVPGFDDPRNRRAFAQPGYHGPGSRNGHLLPFRVNGRTPAGQCLGSLATPTHDWAPQHLSWNGGRNDRFYKVHSQPQWDGPLATDVMGYFDRPGIPYFWALAKAFTLCDMYFCSVLGPTEPNRLYSVSATLDPAGRQGGPSIETVTNGQGLVGDFTWTTMPEQLHGRGISWKSYTEFSGAGQVDSPFPAFRQFRTNPTLNRLGIQPTYPADFEADLARDQLPAVSWVQVRLDESEHPAFPPAKGEYAIDQLLRRIWRHPHIWRKTAVIATHDENGGFFDHVAPPTPPRGTKGEFLSVPLLPASAQGIRGPIGLGFRVPTIIVSPWTRGGLVCSDVFDHTSVLRLIERRFGAEVPNLSRWRRSVTGDLTSAFNFAAAPDYAIPKLPPTSRTSPLVTTGQCSSSSPATPYPVPKRLQMPRQRPGRARRPSGRCGR